MVLLGAKIQGVDTQQPLLCFGGGVVRSAYLLGENSWKWRMQYHVKNQSYDKYDVFVDKIIQVERLPIVPMNIDTRGM